VKKVLVICLALLVLASMVAVAEDAQSRGIITINGNRQTIAMRPGNDFHPAPAHSAGLKTIYSNLGTGTDVYYCCEGWTLSGSGGEVGGSDWIAMPFTPTKAATLEQIDLGIGYVTGTNQIVITLTKDKSGLPGASIHSWTVKNMPTFGTCCTLDTIKYKKGIKVAKGKQYWITATTNAKDYDLWGAWNFTYNDATGTFAYQSGGGGWKTEDSYLGAFDVLGK